MQWADAFAVVPTTFQCLSINRKVTLLRLVIRFAAPCLDNCTHRLNPETETLLECGRLQSTENSPENVSRWETIWQFDKSFQELLPRLSPVPDAGRSIGGTQDGKNSN
jgi:hypothetical protein